jgi:hypothetical protein
MVTPANFLWVNVDHIVAVESSHALALWLLGRKKPVWILETPLEFFTQLNKILKFSPEELDRLFEPTLGETSE